MSKFKECILQKLQLVMLTLISILGSSAAFAHPGHDHSQWGSFAVHALFYLSIASVGALAVYLIKKKLAAKKKQ